jgi:uncharacterized protein (TIGR03437 family)
LGIALTATVWAQAPAGLTVKSATSKQVVLTWTGPGSSFTVQRAPLGGSYTTLGAATSATYTDSSIDPYTTYQYQVLNGAAASSAVTVGPPPSGITNAAQAPLVGTTPADGYGYDLAATLEGNGDPAFIFIWDDPTNNGDHTINPLLFRSWNRAQYQWNPVVKIGVVGDVGTSFRQVASLAYDSSTNTFAAASEALAPLGGNSSIQLYVSSDGGATWTLKNTFTSSNSLYGPSMAFANGNIYLAYTADYDGLTYVTGRLANAVSTWTTKKDPGGSNNTTLSHIAPSLALDSSGNPGIAYFIENPNGPEEYNPTVYFWRPAVTGAPVKVVDNNGHGEDDGSVKLVFYGANPRMLVWIDRGDGIPGEEDDNGVHFVHSEDGGLTWKAPSLVPSDGNASTDYPFDVALDSKDNITAAFGQNSSSGDNSHRCPGGPRISFSSDLTTFTTCPSTNAAVTALKNASSSEFGPYPLGIQVLYGGNDKLYLLWIGDGNTNSTVGVMMYREPPAGAITGPNITAVTDNVSYRANIVGGSWVSIFGTNLSTNSRAWTGNDFTDPTKLPTSLDGVSVRVNGVNAAICYISPTLINIQAPSPISGSVPVQVIVNGASSNTINATAVPNAPSIFAYFAGSKMYPSAYYPDGLYVGDPSVSGNTVRKAKPGDIIQLFVNALASSTSGVTINSASTFSPAPTVTIGGANANVQYAGLVATGLFQLNIVAPSVPSGDQPIVVSIGGQSSQAGVLVPIQ